MSKEIYYLYLNIGDDLWEQFYRVSDFALGYTDSDVNQNMYIKSYSKITSDRFLVNDSIATESVI